MKTVTDKSLTGQLGANLIEAIVLKMGFVWRPTAIFDTGVDGEIEIRNTQSGQMTNFLLKVQSKAGGSYFKAETETSFEFLCTESDLEYWLKGNLPVLLIVSNPEVGEAFWIPIKEYSRQYPQTLLTRKIVFDKRSHRFDESCAENIKKLAVPQERGIYFPPRRRPEMLQSNLLPVTHYPEHIFSAQTNCRIAPEVWSVLAEKGLKTGGEWFLKDKKIFSFHNLHDSSLAQVCEKGTIEAIETKEYAFSVNEEMRRDFVRLLKQCLKEKCWGLHFRYNKEYDCFYFSPAKWQIKTRKPIKLPYKLFHKDSYSTIFHAYGHKTKADVVYYCRHLAFEAEFREFDEVWNCVLTPTYLFTHDGRKLSSKRDEYLSKIKRHENNSNVVRYVRCLGQFLAKKRDNEFFKDYELLQFGNPVEFESDYGIEEEDWLQHEERNLTIPEETKTDDFLLFDR